LYIVSKSEELTIIAEIETLSRRSVDILKFENDMIRREQKYYGNTLWFLSSQWIA
jgi:hypothetical protein